jgi:hypothetical protein
VHHVKSPGRHYTVQRIDKRDGTPAWMVRPYGHTGRQWWVTSRDEAFRLASGR